MNKILVPCDFSAPSREAFQFAQQIASRTKGEIITLHAVYSPLMYDSYFAGGTTFSYVPELLKDFEDEARKKFEKMKKKSSDQGIPVQLEIVHGDLITAINAMIKSKKIDLVIMGTSGASGWQELLIGTNTEKVVRNAKVPVIAINSAPNISSMKKILIPSLLPLNQKKFVDKVKELQDFFSAELHVLLVNTPLHFRPDAEAKKALKDFAHHYKLKDYKLHNINDWHEELGIINFAKEEKIDLIAMATHGRKGLAHLFNGSITEDVVNHIPCPIWTYPLKK